MVVVVGKEKEEEEQEENAPLLLINREVGFRATQWQGSVLQAMRDARGSRGHKVGLLVVATGLGKTVIAILDVDRELEELNDERINRLRRPRRPGGVSHPHAVRVLFLVHSTAIRDAAYAKFCSHFGSQFSPTAFLNYKGKVTGDLRNVVFLFALFQSFDKLNARDFSMVIIDEVHHVLAPSYRKHVDALLKHCNYALGMTATSQHRTDPNGVRIRALFRDTVYFEYSWMAAKRTHFPKDVEYLEALPLLKGGLDVPSYEACLREFRRRDQSLAHFFALLQKSLTQVGMDDPRSILVPQYVCDMLNHYQQARVGWSGGGGLLTVVKSDFSQVEAGLPPRRQILIFAQSVQDAEEIAKLVAVKTKLLVAAVSHKTVDAASTLQSFM